MAIACRSRACDHPFGRQKGVDPPDFCRVDDLHVEADDLRISVNIFEPGQFALIGCKANAARFMPTDILPGEAFKSRIQVVAVSVDLGEIVAPGDAGALPRRMPGGAGSQFILLDEQAIRPAEFGKVIQQARAHDTAANDDYPRACLHEGPFPLESLSAALARGHVPTQFSNSGALAQKISECSAHGALPNHLRGAKPEASQTRNRPELDVEDESPDIGDQGAWHLGRAT